MRKYFKYKLIGLGLIVIAMAACNTADQDVSPVISPDGYPVATFVLAPGTEVTEGDTIIYTITTDKMIERSMTFSFNQTGGTATEDDYVVVPGVIQPYTLSTQVSIITANDMVLGDPKTLIGEIGAFSIADRYLLNPKTVNPKPTFTINNYVSPDLKVSFSWDQEVVIDGESYDAADHIDFDFFVSVAEGFDILDPWATEIGIYDAATGNHPEELTLSGLDDGTYILWFDLWYSDFAGESNNTTMINIVSTFIREGTALEGLTVDLDDSQKILADQAGADNDPGGVFDGVCAKIVVAGGKYQILDFNDADLGTYKSGAVRARRPANIPHTK